MNVTIKREKSSGAQLQVDLFFDSATVSTLAGTRLVVIFLAVRPSRISNGSELDLEFSELLQGSVVVQVFQGCKLHL